MYNRFKMVFSAANCAAASSTHIYKGFSEDFHFRYRHTSSVESTLMVGEGGGKASRPRSYFLQSKVGLDG